MLTFRLFFLIALASGISSRSFAKEGCNRHCREQIFSHLAALEDKVKNAIPIGTILPYSGSAGLPQGYLLCDGSAVDQGQYRALFEAVGLTFTPPVAQGEAARPTFRLPDLRGRVAVGAGTGTTLTLKALGDTFGTEKATLVLGNLPPHRHGGTTGANDRGHRHTGNTSSDGAHSHTWHSGAGRAAGGNQQYARNDAGFNFPLQTTIDGAHTHSFTSDRENQNHTHTFTTNDGSALNLASTPFSIEQPSLVIRYMIKAE